MYCIICNSARFDAKIRELFARADQNNRDFIKIAGNNNCGAYYIAKNAATDRKGKEIFKGYLIDDDFRRIAYGVAAANTVGANKISRRGCYISLNIQNETITVTNDLFGVLPILYSQDPGLIVVSNSMLVICAIRKALGIKNTINEEVLIAQAWLNGMASQVMGFDTIFRNIKFAPLNSRLHIDLSGTDPDLSIKYLAASRLFDASRYGSADYRGYLREAARRLVGVSSAVASLDHCEKQLCLSGGLDSRLCLAAFGADLGRLRVQSSKSIPEDYRIASIVCANRRINFKNARACPHEIMNPAPYWFLKNAGVHTQLVHRSPTSWNGIIECSGRGAETVKCAFKWRSMDELAPIMTSVIPMFEDHYKAFIAGQKLAFSDRLKKLLRIPVKNRLREIGAQAYQQACRALEAIGVDPHAKAASEWHHLYFKNPFHLYGHWANLTDLAPLLDPAMTALKYSPLNPWPEAKQGGSSSLTDLLILLAPDLAALPFENPAQNMNTDFISERKKFLGDVGESEPYAITGHPEDANSGIPACFRQFLTGYAGEFNHANIMKWATYGFEKMPASVRPYYEFWHGVVKSVNPAFLGAKKTWYYNVACKLFNALLIDD